MALGVYPAARGLTSLIVEALKADGRPDGHSMNLVELVVGSAAMLALLLGVVGVCIGISIGAVVESGVRFAVLVVVGPPRHMLEAIRAAARRARDGGGPLPT